jgi:hypothetical protein
MIAGHVLVIGGNFTSSGVNYLGASVPLKAFAIQYRDSYSVSSGKVSSKITNSLRWIK